MTQISNKFKKPCFWPIFPIFGATRFFKKNLALSCTTRHGPLNYAEFQKKLMGQSQENFWMEGQKDGQTPIHRTLPAMAGGPKKQMLSFVSDVEESSLF